MGFWGQMWMGKEDKARKIFEEQFGEPCPRAGGDGKNCILRWPQKKPFIYIKNVYSNGKMIKKEWYIFDNNTWRFVGRKNNSGQVCSDEQWEEAGARKFYDEYNDWKKLFK